LSLFLTALKRLKDEDNEEGKKKEEEEEEVDDAIVVGVSDAVLDTVKRLKYKARARNFYISGVVVEKRMAKLNAETKKFLENRTQKNCEKEKSSYKTFSKRKQWRRERRKSVR
jgi:hypothetical protein